MSKLFAFENADVVGDEVELETPVEAGEVADVEVDVMEEGGEIDEQAEAIVEGVEASDQMEEVEALVEQAAEEGEGLDPVAAEAIRIAVEAICARVGANPKSMYALYATENFQSASSRKANTRFALEGVGEFLKDLWKKIKTALTNLWAKAQAFWDKHVSSLGRIKKALESMKTKVNASSGKLEGKAYLEEAPGALSDALGGGEISASSFNSIIEAHKKLLDSSDDVVSYTKALNEASTETVSNPGKEAKAFAESFDDKKISGLIGGLTWSTEIEIDFEAGTVNYETVREYADKGEKGGVQLADKAAVKSLIDKVLSLINDNIKAKEKNAKLQEAFKKFSMTVEKAINASVSDSKTAEEAKTMRKAMKIVYKINAKTPSINNECLALNVRLSKTVLSYAGLCLKNYK